MRIAKQDIPVRIDVPGAIARQKTNFGDAAGYGTISGEYFSLSAGTDIAPLLQGLEGDLCQSPHWGYVLQGELTVTYADGTNEMISGGDLFYWPPTHKTEIVSLEVSGDLAVERGRYQLSATPKANGAAITETGKHIVVRRRVDGSWKIQWEIWNVDSPPPTQ